MTAQFFRGILLCPLKQTIWYLVCVSAIVYLLTLTTPKLRGGVQEAHQGKPKPRTAILPFQSFWVVNALQILDLRYLKTKYHIVFLKEAVISPFTKLLVKHSRRNFFLDNLCMGAKNFEKSMHRNWRPYSFRKDNLVLIAFLQKGIVIPLRKIMKSNIK